MSRLIVFLILCAGFTALLTLVLNYFLSSRKYVKYVPGGILFLLAVYNYVQARQNQGEGFQDLAFLVMAMLLLAGAVGGLLTALVLERRNRG